METLDELCRWLLNGEPGAMPAAVCPLYGGWEAAAVRTHLLTVAAEAVADGVLGHARASTWCAFWGLGQPPVSRRALAQMASVSPDAIYKRRRQAAAIVAAYLSRLEVPPTPPATSSRTATLEEALALLHSDLVFHGEATPSATAALADLRRDLVGADLPKHHPGSDKHARRRARQRLRERLPSVLEPVHPAVVVGGRRDKTHGLDATVLEAEILAAEARYWARDPTIHDSLDRARRQLASLHGSLAPMTEAALWSVQARLWREEEDIRTVWAARRVEQLAGPHSVLSVQARDDAAIALEEHGYLQAAMACVERAAANLLAAPVDPVVQRMHLGSLITRAVAIATRGLLVNPRPGDVEAARLRLDRLFRLLDRHADEPLTGWALVAYRRRVQLDLADALRQRRHEGYRRGLLLPTDTGRYVALAAAEAARTPGRLWKMTWRMTLLALALERGDPDGFEAIARQVVQLMDAEPWQFDNQLERYYRLVRRAEQRRDRLWKAITLAEPQARPVLGDFPSGRPDPSVKRMPL
jgi:hypothetical protein